MGAQAMGRAREALCPYGLFVSPDCSGAKFQKKSACHTRIANRFSRRFWFLDYAQFSAPAGCAAMPATRF
jgi:hypothetical protein